MLYGYGEQIIQGTWMTIELSLLSLLFALILGLMSALARLSGRLIPKLVSKAYTTLIRSVPDIVLMFLIFYSLQNGLNSITDALGMRMIQIEPFTAGAVTIGFIYGAYFSETIRGAFMAVPKGQFESARAFGMGYGLMLRRIILPQVLRIALPGLGNNWLVVLKATALVSLIQLSDLVQVTQSAGRATNNLLLFTSIAGLIYLILTSLSNVAFWWLERKLSVGYKEVSL